MRSGRRGFPFKGERRLGKHVRKGESIIYNKSIKALGNTHLCVLQLPRRKFLLMDYLKYNLTPLDEVKGDEPKTEAEKAAREELKRHRQETQRYKQKYFEYYDDVKINHREDW